jgi:hypothetical protein
MNALKQKAAWENGFVSIANKALPFSSAVIMTLLMFSAGAWASLPSFRVSGTVTETQKLGELKPALTHGRIWESCIQSLAENMKCF